MRKKWKRYKNRIMALGMALSISCSSVFLPSMEVEASEVEELEIEGVWQDLNEDGQMNVNEVNYARLIVSSFVRAGIWVDTGVQAFNDIVEGAKSLFFSSPETILGYLGEDGLVYLSNDTWDYFLSLANDMMKSDGYTVFPALESSKLYWYNLSGASFSTNYFNSFIGSSSDFSIGMPVAKQGSVYYFTACTNSYYTRVQDNSIVYIKSGSNIGTYYRNGLKFQKQIVGSNNYVSRYQLSNSSGKWSAIDWNSDMYVISPFKYFLGTIGRECIVFDSAADALNYYEYNRYVYSSSHGGSGGSIPLNDLNSKDWEELNKNGYDYIKDSLQNGDSLTDSDVQKLIDEFTEEVLSDMEFISGEQVKQTSFLQRIYELLAEWLPFIGNKDTDVDVDVDVNIEEDMSGFDEDSNNQSEELDGLIQDSQVEKPDIDNTNQLVDDNLDMGNVVEYGTLLSVFTGNQRILSFILISLTVGLIAYVFYGKR